MQTNELTDAQHSVIGALDDAVEHLHAKFDPHEYEGFSTCGFAHIANIDGRSSFVRSVKSLADSHDPNVNEDRRGDIVIDVGGVEMSLRKDSYRGGYRLSITNVPDLAIGASHQRMDLRERLHELILERLQFEHGYLDDAYVSSRMD